MNRLANETSPYLLQHAENPVDWHPWDEATLAVAAETAKPLLLSIGYAACHWCHVMAHESFEDSEIASIMNRDFINIKIDREERPDLDTIYQSALALLGEQGGWPLTMFCTPDGKPFWGGTYFPPVAKFGRPGFPDLLKHISRIYREEPEKVSANSTAIIAALKGLSQTTNATAPGADELVQAAQNILQYHDSDHGGFGTAPKFPQAPVLAFLWRAAVLEGDSDLAVAVTTTLEQMAQGGIYDHLGGGFARYATDAAWLVPHFEKMLYDNAQLIALYSDAWRSTKAPLHANRVQETIDWVLRDMTHDEGAFYASIDADSDGEEGRFYTWSAAEILSALGDDADIFTATYNVLPQGNWEGRNILNRLGGSALLDPQNEARLSRCREILLRDRQHRNAPATDDKILTDWNGLMIAALANAALTFERDDWLAAARKAFAFILDKLPPPADPPRLCHSWRQARARHAGNLDDYANMSLAGLALYAAEQDPEILEVVLAWVSVLNAHFWDADNGGYFFTPDDTRDVLLRTKSGHDNATPSGNGTMIEVLSRLAALTGDPAYDQRAEEVLAAYAGEAQKSPLGYGAVLSGAVFHVEQQQLVLVSEQADHPACRAMVSAFWSSPSTTRQIQQIASTSQLEKSHPAFAKTMIDGNPTAYLCRRGVCSEPITDPATLSAALHHRA